MPDLSEWDKLNALAMQHHEGWRVFHDDKHGEIRYEIASLPAGCVAMRMKAAYRCGDVRFDGWRPSMGRLSISTPIPGPLAARGPHGGAVLGLPTIYMLVLTYHGAIYPSAHLFDYLRMIRVGLSSLPLLR